MLVCKDSTTHAVVTKIIVRLVNYVKACKNVEYTDITLTELGRILHSPSPLLGYRYLKWNCREGKLSLVNAHWREKLYCVVLYWVSASLIKNIKTETCN